MTDGRALLDAYLNGEDLSEQQLADLSAWVCASRDNATLAAELMHLNQSIGERVLAKSVGSLAGADEATDWGVVLSELAEQEQAAEPAVIALDASKPTRKQAHEDAGSISAHDLASVGGYLLRQALTSRSAYLAYAAALALLCLIVFGPWGDETVNDASPRLAQQPLEKDRTGAAATSEPVATLTATHNAHWGGEASAAPAQGDTLHAKQRLTLTAGFAKITTQRGAVAILQAPCTVEMIDSPNAIRLHVGQLVGICETPSSKGFVVKTPHADITDLGTRFGVEISPNGITNLQVFRGEVSVVPIGPGGLRTSPQALVAGQAAKLSAINGLQRVGMKPDTFAGLRGHLLLGQIKESFEPVLSLVPGDIESNDFMLLVPERKSVLLDQPLEVLLAASNSPASNDRYARRTLEAGTLVDSYLVHFDSAADQVAAADIINLKGDIRFDRPILGVILDNGQIHETVKLFGRGEVQYPSLDFGVGIEETSDQVTISPDGKTLRLSLTAKGSSPLGIDQVRVLVQAKESSE